MGIKSGNICFLCPFIHIILTWAEFRDTVAQLKTTTEKHKIHTEFPHSWNEKKNSNFKVNFLTLSFRIIKKAFLFILKSLWVYDIFAIDLFLSDNFLPFESYIHIVTSLTVDGWKKKYANFICIKVVNKVELRKNGNSLAILMRLSKEQVEFYTCHKNKYHK